MVTSKFGEQCEREKKCVILTNARSSRDLEKIDRPIYSVKGHKEIINAIDGVGGLGIGEGAPEIATASRDGWLTCKVSSSADRLNVVIRR